jgi:hypothetical protein
VIADAGLWIGLDRGDRRTWALLEVLRQEGIAPLTSAAIVAQVWRGGPRQARLAIALRAADVIALTDDEAREVGALLGEHDGGDVADGHLALLAARHPGRSVATGDRRDLEALGVAAARVVDL